MSKITFEMTPEERAAFILDARKELVDRLYHELAEDVQTISKAKLAGMLDVDPKTIEAMGIPRVPFTVGKLIKYRLKTVIAWLEAREEK